ncbi:hypothetical protein, partial [Actinoplanes sp. NPDC005259]|uniref:hypothetical protein n=1 Tax=Actinoplanes sp. NPDC005259 TaxID=3154674 RepID=UPI0033AE8613
MLIDIVRCVAQHWTHPSWERFHGLGTESSGRGSLPTATERRVPVTTESGRFKIRSTVVALAVTALAVAGAAT